MHRHPTEILTAPALKQRGVVPGDGFSMMVNEQVRIAVITAGVVMEGLLREVVMDAVREWRREGRGCATGRCICEGGNSHPDDAAEKVNPAHGGAVWSEAVVRPTNGWLLRPG